MSSAPLSVFALLAKQTKDEILELVLRVAELVGLPVSSWRTGDPTRTQFSALATKMEAADEARGELARACFITGPEEERAEGDWLTLRVSDVYGIERDESEFSTPSVTVDNTGGGYYELEPGGLVVSSSATGSTFHNQATVIIEPSETGVEISLVADVAGSAGSVGVDEIDTIVSPAIGDVVEIVSSTAAQGSDEQSDTGLIEQALATLGALSPNGPADAYEFVARNEDLTDIAGVTRAKADGDSSDGTVTVYVATTTTALDGPSVAAIQLACDVWAQPLCTDATVVSGTPSTIAVTLSGVPADAQEAVESAISALFAGIDFGGLIARDAITSAARVACATGGFTVAGAIGISAPIADSTLGAGVFPVRGTVTLA